MRVRAAFLCALCLLPTPARGYTRSRTSQGVLLRRPDANRIEFVVSDRTAAGLANDSGATIITPDSDPVAALQAAADNWNAVATATATFAPLTLSPDQTASTGQPNGQNLLTFADTPENRSAVGAGTIAITRIFFTPSTGDILDTDTVFNPQLSFSTTLQAGTYDIEAVMTHELGHALGANHSGLLGASMFFSARRGVPDSRMVSSDDAGFLTDAYPGPASNSLGTITGTVRLEDGSPVRGALVSAIDPSTASALGAITTASGGFTISRMPPGQYVLSAEPADGPVEPNQLAEAGSGAHVNFSTAVLGGVQTPTRLAVGAGATAQADLTVGAGTPALNITQGGSGLVGGSIAFGSGAFPLTRGTASDILLIGRGLDDASIGENTISFLGAPITVRTGSLDRGVNPSNGLPYLRFTVQVAPNAALGLQSVAVRSTNGTAVFSGGIRLQPAAPAFPANGVVSAATFQAGGVAPGEIVSIFGAGLGPGDGVGAARNRGTGRLSYSLGNVTVTFNGVRAPLYFVRNDQINAQVPFEIAGQTTAQVVVRHHLVANQPVSVPLLPAHPGIFAAGGTPRRAVALNQDGTLNSPANALPRGQVAVLFATGQGVVSPPVATGQFALSDPLSGVTQSAVVTFGGVPGEVLFAGLAPGFVGLLQVNVRVPDSAPVGDAPLRLTIGGASSPSDVVVSLR